MGLTVLKSILDKKLDSVSQELENEQRQIDSIAQLQETIRVIKENPYILCTDDGEKYIKLLGLDEYNLPTLRKIYDGFVLLGREAIPQISIVDEAMEKIKGNLEQKICFGQLGEKDIKITHFYLMKKEKLILMLYGIQYYMIWTQC